MRSTPVAIAAGAVAILVLVLGGVAIIGSPSKVATPSPTLNAQPSVSPVASAVASTAVAFDQPGTGVASQGRITFSYSDPNEKRFLYTIGADGTALDQIVAAEPCCGVWSPDGSRLAIGEVDPGTSSYRTAIFPVGGGAPTLLPASCPQCGSLAALDSRPRAWSPDGHWVAIEGFSDGEAQRTGLYLAVADGKPGSSGVTWFPTFTGAGVHDSPLAFSPDNRRLLFKRSTGDGDAGDLYVIDIPHDPGPGFTPKPVKLNPSGTTIVSSDAFGSGASWSPDGTQVAFAANDGSASGGSIYVVDITTGNATAIADGSRTTTSARWSPDGQWIAYDIPSAFGPHDEWIVHPDGPGGRNLTPTLVPGVCCGEWSPDSRYLVVQGGSYQNTDRPDQLIALGLDGTSGTIVKLATPTQLEDYSWAPVTN